MTHTRKQAQVTQAQVEALLQDGNKVAQFLVALVDSKAVEIQHFSFIGKLGKGIQAHGWTLSPKQHSRAVEVLTESYLPKLVAIANGGAVEASAHAKAYEVAKASKPAPVAKPKQADQLSELLAMMQGITGELQALRADVDALKNKKSR